MDFVGGTNVDNFTNNMDHNSWVISNFNLSVFADGKSKKKKIVLKILKNNKIC